MNLLSHLVKNKLLKQEQASMIESKAEQEDRPVEELLIEEGMVSENDVFRSKADLLQVPLRSSNPDDVSIKILKLIPEESAKYYRMLPIGEANDKLEIGMVYPEDNKAKDALKFLSRQARFSYTTVLVTPSTFEDLLEKYRESQSEAKQALEELSENIEQEKDEKVSGKDLSRLVEDAPITKVVAVILRNAVEGHASDIHIEPTKDALRVRFRFLGDLHQSLLLPKEAHPAVLSRVKILSGMRIDETRVPQDGRFSTTISDNLIDFRVATMPTALGEKVAIRVLDPKTGLKSLEDLGLSGSGLEKVKDSIHRSYGLVFSTGPTGSGKTTTLYAILRELNSEKVNIVSIEDPVEYMISGVNQSHVRPEIGYDFAEGLREMLRQDPDIMMVGEVRDEETASLVIHAALTGHVVLSTLHTNTAMGVVPRLLDMGVERYLLPATMSCAVGQRLVLQLCQECREQVSPRPAMEKMIKSELKEFPESARKEIAHLTEKIMVYEPKGCKACGESGYAGRLGLFEVLVMTDELADIILERPVEHEIAKEADRQEMTTMRQDGIRKVLEGRTTMEEVLRVTAKR